MNSKFDSMQSIESGNKGEIVIMHIYEDEELEENSTCRKFRQVRKEGKRTVSRVLVRPEWAYKERGLHPSRPRSNYKKQLIHSF